MMGGQRIIKYLNSCSVNYVDNNSQLVETVVVLGDADNQLALSSIVVIAWVVHVAPAPETGGFREKLCFVRFALFRAFSFPLFVENF